MFLAKEWEMFYTDSIEGKDLVNQISIDAINKRYILDLGVSHLATDGFDDEGNLVCSIYVSPLVFDIIVSGVKLKEFVEYRQYSD